MSIQQQKFKEIADKIREKLGTTDVIKPSDFAGKIDEVYTAGQNAGGGGSDAPTYEQGFEAGKIAERDAFWGNYQQNGARTSWAHAFYGKGWTDENYAPQYPIRTSGAFTQMYAYSSITDTLVPLSFGLHASTQVFRDSAIKNIPSLTVASGQTFSNWFANCYDLENVTFVDCEIEQNISFSNSKKLTHDCLVHILSKLADKSSDTSGTQFVCTLGTDNLNKLTNEEKAIATGKGWGLA